MSIRSEIETRFKTWADANSVIPVFETQNYTRTNVPYCEFRLVSRIGVATGLAYATHRVAGIAQFNICVKLGTGTKITEDLVESLKKAFPVAPKIGNIYIDKPVDVQPIFIQDDWQCVLVSVYFHSEVVS